MQSMPFRLLISQDNVDIGSMLKKNTDGRGIQADLPQSCCGIAGAKRVIGEES